MGEPMTQQRLKNYIALKMEVEHQLERIARMKAEEKFPGMKESDGSQHQPGAGDRMERAIIRRMEYEERIMPVVHGNMDEMETIEKAIDALLDPMEREVLRLRYIDGSYGRHLPWGDVAVQIYGDNDEKCLQATCRLHGRALQNIKKESHL